MARPRKIALMTFRGETKPREQWAAELGVRDETLRARIHRHGVERAMTMPRGRWPLNVPGVRGADQTAGL
jgi:hypothetical protein